MAKQSKGAEQKLYGAFEQAAVAGRLALKPVPPQPKSPEAKLFGTSSPFIKTGS